MSKEYAALTRDDIIKVIEGRGNAPRVPMMLHFWVSPQAFADPAPIQALMARYPQDVQTIQFNIPSVFDAPSDDPSYRWSYTDVRSKGGALDSDGFIEDWDEELDAFLADFPSAEYPGLISDAPAPDGRYRLGCWWYFFFERFWSIRSMEDALTDFYLYPEAVHAFFRRLTDFYKVMLRRGKEELGLDGVFTSDDLGTQQSVFFSSRIFDEFFYPYYKEVVDYAHQLGMHFWLHTCGNVAEFLPKFIDIGIDVIHPIQKYAMDEAEAARKYGSDICIWAGFDVQRTIPYGTSDDVRREVRFMVDTYLRRDGRFMFTLGNAATGDTPFDSLTALLDEAFSYSTLKVAQLAEDISPSA